MLFWNQSQIWKSYAAQWLTSKKWQNKEISKNANESLASLSFGMIKKFDKNNAGKKTLQ